MIKQGSRKIHLGSLIIIHLFVMGFSFPGTVWSQRLLTTFRPGDAIRLQIWQPWRITEGKAEILDLNGDYPINSQGYTMLPLIGEVKVIGLNQTTLMERLKGMYSPFIKDPYIMVTPLIRVTLQGSINRPGAFLVPPTASLWEVVELASGPNESADLKAMHVERAGKTINKSLLRSFEKGYSLQEVGIMSGDQIIVPARKSFGYRDALFLASFALQIGVFYLQVTR